MDFQRQLSSSSLSPEEVALMSRSRVQHHRYSPDVDSNNYNYNGGFFLPANFSPWTILPAAMQLSVWVFVDPWPIVMSLREVSKEWNTLIGRLEPNAPSAQLAYEQGRQIERDVIDGKEFRRRVRRVQKRDRKDIYVREKEIERERERESERDREIERERERERESERER
jgi:hypothetical protein